MKRICIVILALSLICVVPASAQYSKSVVSHDQSGANDWKFGAVAIGTAGLGTPALNATATFSGSDAYITIANNCIIDLTSWGTTGSKSKKTLEIINGGAATITWKSNGSAVTPKYSGGVAPTFTASGRDTVVLTSRDGGTTVDLYVAGQDMR